MTPCINERRSALFATGYRHRPPLKGKEILEVWNELSYG